VALWGRAVASVLSADTVIWPRDWARNQEGPVSSAPFPLSPPTEPIYSLDGSSPRILRKRLLYINVGEGLL
jgi:hypothetical protein